MLIIVTVSLSSCCNLLSSLTAVLPWEFRRRTRSAKATAVVAGTALGWLEEDCRMAKGSPTPLWLLLSSFLLIFALVAVGGGEARNLRAKRQDGEVEVAGQPPPPPPPPPFKKKKLLVDGFIVSNKKKVSETLLPTSGSPDNG